MSAYGLFLLALFVVLIALLIALFLPIRRWRATTDSPADHERTEPVYRDDDRYWFGGLLYYNTGDPDPIVPKRYGFGWTVNFGHPYGMVFALFLIGLMLLPIVLAILDPGLSSFGCHPSGCSQPFP